VFVRGEVPSDVDQDAIRDVIRAVPGVRDVDLQLGG
jgi:osmotically-inducible protein OsmY